MLTKLPRFPASPGSGGLDPLTHVHVPGASEVIRTR